MRSSLKQLISRDSLHLIWIILFKANFKPADSQNPAEVQNSLTFFASIELRLGFRVSTANAL